MALILTAFMTSALATTDDTPLTANVTVKSTFSIQLETTTLDLGVVEPGSASEKKTVGLSCVTNNNKPWSVSITAQSPFSSGQYEIPLSNFKWEISGAPGVPSGELSLNAVNIYTAQFDDYVTEQPINLSLALWIDVPQGQVAGRYATTILITMHEE